MKIVGIVPARLNSTRLPGKVLLPIDGIPMVAKTALNAKMCDSLDKVIVAVDDKNVYDQVKSHKIEVHMTSLSHTSGTDRIYEVAEKLNLEEEDIVINIQADEPFMSCSVINDLVKCLMSKETEMATVGIKKISQKEISNENVVKVFVDENQKALDFSRVLKSQKKCYKHVGLYGFKMKTLKRFVRLKRTQNEIDRKLEQMRALDNGISIDLIMSEKDFLSIDTQQDYEKALEGIHLR